MKLGSFLSGKRVGVISLIVIILVLFNFVGAHINGHFVKGPNMNMPRAYHQTIKLADGNVLITGGINSTKNENFGLNTAEIFDVNTQEFKLINNMNLPHTYHSMFKMSDGNIVIADINGIEVFDVKNKKFKLLKSKFTKRYQELDNYKFSLLPEDRLLIVGGRQKLSVKNNSFGTNLININLCEILDIKNDKIIKKININGNGFGIIELKDGNLLFLGGKNDNNKMERLIDDIKLFDTKQMKVLQWGRLTHSLFNPFVFITSDNKVVIIGGEIIDKQEEINGYKYLFTKGSPYIEIIDLYTKNKTVHDISALLKKTYNNEVLDVVQYSDTIYWLQLKSDETNNTTLINISTLQKMKIIPSVLNFIGVFRSSNIKFQNGIFITGGKFLYKEPTEYSINDEQKPYAAQRFNVNGEGNVTKHTYFLKMK